mgnify:CR=1 FL=1
MVSQEERRNAIRHPRLENYRVEIKLVGQPIYQFRVTDVSTKGAGLLISRDSAFLKLIEVGQELDVNFISPQGFQPAGLHKAEIRHITDNSHNKYRGALLVGIQIRECLETS